MCSKELCPAYRKKCSVSVNTGRELSGSVGYNIECAAHKDRIQAANKHRELLSFTVGFTVGQQIKSQVKYHMAAATGQTGNPRNCCWDYEMVQ